MKKLVMVLVVFLGIAVALCALEPGMWGASITLECPIMNDSPEDSAFPNLVSELRYAASVYDGESDVRYYLHNNVRVSDDTFDDMSINDIFAFASKTGFISGYAFVLDFQFYPPGSDDLDLPSKPQVLYAESEVDGEYGYVIAFKVNKDGSIVCPPLATGSKFVAVDWD
jgi:hypothetical protein